MIPATEAGAQQAMAATSAASAVAAWWAMATDVAHAIFGVDLQVILAAATGAYAARSFKCRTTYIRALFGGLGWTLFGVICCQLIVWGLTKIVGEAPPKGALAGAALMASAVGQIFITQDMINRLRDAVSRYIDQSGRKQ